MKAIKDLLCLLSFHPLKTVYQYRTVDVLECAHCRRRWAVETEKQIVLELKGRRA